MFEDTPSFSQFGYQFKRYCEYEAEAANGKTRQKQLSIPKIETKKILFSPFPSFPSKNLYEPIKMTSKEKYCNCKDSHQATERNMYSRENIQLMNKKMRLFKEVLIFNSNLKLENERNSRSKELKIKMNPELLSNRNQNEIVMNRSKSTFSIKTCKSTGRMRGKNIEQSKKLKLMTKHQSAKSAKSPSQPNEIGKTTYQPQFFRSTLRKKLINDNPKIFINVIKRKVKNMNNNQIHKFIQSVFHQSRQ